MPAFFSAFPRPTLTAPERYAQVLSHVRSIDNYVNNKTRNAFKLSPIVQSACMHELVAIAVLAYGHDDKVLGDTFFITEMAQTVLTFPHSPTLPGKLFDVIRSEIPLLRDRLLGKARAEGASYTS